MSEYNEFKQELLKNQKVKAEYDALAPEYDIIQAMIDARKEQNIAKRNLPCAQVSLKPISAVSKTAAAILH